MWVKCIQRNVSLFQTIHSLLFISHRNTLGTALLGSVGTITITALEQRQSVGAIDTTSSLFGISNITLFVNPHYTIFTLFVTKYHLITIRVKIPTIKIHFLRPYFPRAGRRITWLRREWKEIKWSWSWEISYINGHEVDRYHTVMRRVLRHSLD